MFVPNHSSVKDFSIKNLFNQKNNQYEFYTSYSGLRVKRFTAIH